MSEAELRERWEKLLSTKEKELLNMLWSDLKENYSEYIDDALRDSRLITDLVDLAEARIKYWRSGSERPKPVGRAAQTTVEVQISDYERECAETASLYLAKKAASLPELRRFRQERLGSRLLTTDEAKEFLRREELGDESDSDSLSEDDIGWLEAVNHMSVEELLDLVVPASGPAIVTHPDQLFPYESGGFMMLKRKKIAENYGDLSRYLAAIFPWDLDQAARFILTGERPEVVPLELSYHRSRRVFTLNFAPWVSEKTFRKAYRKCQKVVQGGDNRRMKERTLAVVRFVTEHTDDEGRRLLSWSQLTDLWNGQHPSEWSFKDRFGLRKAYL
jgi:hypothetical protein